MRRHKRNRNSYFLKGGDDDICRITGISAGKWFLGELVSFLIILPVDNTVGRPSAIEIWTPLEWIVFLIGPVDMSMAVTSLAKLS